MKKDANKRDFISELSVINKNKFSIQQTKNLYMGILYELILNRVIFVRNNDLNDFLKKVFEKEYNDYLFKSRPYLASRLLKYVSEEYDSLKISASIKLIISFLHENDLQSGSDNREKKPTNKIEEDVIGWYNSVSKGSNGD
ncbi:hypothetical protein [Paenibacillus sp. UNC217MF]|uniref:hypothetical protein n=1 Tax=Paenibacillus sp. UNC217MF TaxID=1449062 RepID=UPI00068BBF5F|nr:hypothetical protein [Paenibacillus sp. UNC217MF]